VPAENQVDAIPVTNDIPAVAGIEVAEATPRRWAWPDLIVDIGCADLYEDHLTDAVGHGSPVTLDVGKLLRSGASTVLKRASAVVFGAATRNGLPLHEPIEQLRAWAPHVGIYVVAAGEVDVSRWMPLFSVSGVDDVFPLGSPAGLHRRAWTLRQRLTAPAPETELRLLWRWFRDSPERSLIMHCVRNAYWVDDWARRAGVFGATRRTLQYRLSAERLPSPGLLARCGRMLHAQELERRGVEPSRDVAVMIGIPSAAALQRARRRLRRSLMSKGPQALVFASLLR